MSFISHFLNSHLVNIFLRNNSSAPSLSLKFVGGILILLGGVIGFYFAFQYLTFFLGYFETGIILSVTLIGLGLLLFFIGRSKTTNPPIIQQFLDNTSHTLKGLDINGSLKENLPRVIPLCLLAGFILSQVPSGDKKH